MLRRTVVTLLGTLLLVGVSAGSASAHEIFKAGVEGIQVGGQFIAGIPGGAPWDVAFGFTTVKSNGQLKAKVEGLVLTTPIIPADPVFPVTGVCGSLVCQKTVAGDPTNEQVAVTGSFPLSPVAGDTMINEVIALPAGVCVAPIVLLRVSEVDAGFLAASCAGGATPAGCVATGISVSIGGCVGPWIAASGL